MFGKTERIDKRSVSEIPLEELESIVEERKRIERARAFTEADDTRRFAPITVEPNDKQKRRRRRGLRDHILFAVEVLAVLGLIGIIAAALLNLQALNQEVIAAVRGNQVVPETPAATVGLGPTPQLGELPGSSFSPSTGNELPGSSLPPEALPASIGVTVQQAPALPPPTPGPQSPTRIVVPAIGVDWPIVPGDGWEQLKLGVGHHAGSSNPGERGNMILSGHNDVFGEVFKDLEALKNGDEIHVFAGGKMFKYEVRAKRIVLPNELSVLQQTREAVVTLITCHPYRVDTHRLVVIAQLIP
jgi:sortase A